MMPELAMSVLDIAQNSVRAKATLIEIEIAADQAADTLTIRSLDDGCGMTPEQVAGRMDVPVKFVNACMR